MEVAGMRGWNVVVEGDWCALNVRIIIGHGGNFAFK